MPTRRSTSLTGAAGEHHVLAQLLAREWIAALAPQGAPMMDIVVTDTAGDRLAALQVKTRWDYGGDGGWAMRKKHEAFDAARAFYAFVDLGSEPGSPITTWIVPARIVADAVRTAHVAWLAAPGRGGRARNEHDMRRILPDFSKTVPTVDPRYGAGWMAPFEEDWDRIGAFE